ncbi:CP-RdRp fusion protein [Phytophthora cactorum RNA virus 1]|uniref:RNA-directed RNA polymerase n=2 Tax=Phytophthora cactorum RNA virus 1 TaxID=2735399 RepID=A0A6M4RVH3_9VIRU|nr:CP-RdRp fusion protein [Phytophthora cactorum RNA virus 1]
MTEQLEVNEVDVTTAGRVGEFEQLVSSYCSNNRLDGSDAERLLNGRVAREVKGLFNETFFSERSAAVLGGWRPINVGSYTEWDDHVSGPTRVESARETFAMVPAGRAAKEAFDWEYHLPMGDNVRLGDYGMKAQAALEAEAAGFDAGFQRAVRRDRGEVHLRVYAELAKSDRRWLGYTLETYCSSYVARAVTRNLLSNDCAAHLTVAGAAQQGLTTDRIVVDAGHAVPGGADRSRARFYGAESYGEVSVQNRVDSVSPEHSWVFPGKDANGVWAAVFAAWAASLAEMAVAGDGAELQIFIPVMTDDMITAAFRSVGLPCSAGDLVNPARVAHWLLHQHIHPREEVGAAWTREDVERLVVIQAYERFRYQVAGTRYAALNQFDATANAVSLPVASLQARMAGVLGIYAPTGGWGTALAWTKAETAAFDRGVTLGAIGDVVFQRVAGHWMNLGQIPGRASVQMLLETILNMFLHAGKTDKGVVDLAMRVSVNEVDPADQFADGFWHSWPQRMEVSRCRMNRYAAEADFEDGQPAARADEWGYSGPGRAYPTINQRGAVAAPRVWYVMRRANWFPGFVDKFGALLKQPKATFEYDPSRGTAQEYPIEAADGSLHAVITRAVLFGDAHLMMRQRAANLPHTLLQIVQTGVFVDQGFLFASAEVLELVASNVVALTATQRQWEFIRSGFGIYESKRTVAAVPSRAENLLFLGASRGNHKQSQNHLAHRPQCRGRLWVRLGVFVETFVSACVCNGDRIGLVRLSDADRPLCRPLVPWGINIRRDYLKLGEKWGKAFTLYRRHLPTLVRFRLDLVVQKLPTNICETCLIDCLKIVSRCCLEEIIATGVSDNLYLLDLQVLGGYDTEPNRVDPLDSLREEFCVPAASEGSMPERLKFWVDDTLDKISYCGVKESFPQFVAFRDAWANPGASTYGHSAKISISKMTGGETFVREVKLRNKWFKALAFSDATIVEDCLKGEANFVRPFRKRDEPAKARTVQCYDTRSLIRCSYLARGISDLNGHSTWTTLDMSAGDRAKLRRRLLYKDGKYRLCTDQSSFDINQSRESVCYVLAQLFRRIVKFGNNKDLCEVAKAELSAMDDTWLDVVNDRWRKGVLSGMKFTALVDSILNRAASMFVAEEVGFKVEVGYFQGDDAVMVVAGRPPSVAAVAQAYSDLGLDVNPLKSWLGVERCEFLHEVYDGTSVYGFPARAAKTLMWSKPATGPKVGGAQSVREDIGMLVTASRRRLVGLLGVGRALFSRLGATLEKFNDCWFTPTVMGGLGFGSQGRVGLSLESVRRRKVRIDVTSEVQYGLERGLLLQACMQRASGVISLPGYVTEIKFSVIRGLAEMPSVPLERAKRAGRVRTEWLLSDYRIQPAPYLKKLRYEAKLTSRTPITQGDLPTKVFDMVGDLDKAVRWYEAQIRKSATLVDAYRHHEPFHGIARLGNAVWGGLCALAGAELLDKGQMGDLKRQLIGTLWSQIVQYKLYINYFI